MDGIKTGAFDYLSKPIELEQHKESVLQSRNLRYVAGSAILTALILGVLLAFVLTQQILIPIRRLAFEAGRHASGRGDEVNVLRRSVRGLMKNAGNQPIGSGGSGTAQRVAHQPHGERL